MAGDSLQHMPAQLVRNVPCHLEIVRVPRVICLQFSSGTSSAAFLYLYRTCSIEACGYELIIVRSATLVSCLNQHTACRSAIFAPPLYHSQNRRMEGLSGAASVIAVIELSAKIASLCVRYSLAVKHAKDDIGRFRREINSITDLLEDVNRMLERPDHTQLSTSVKLKDALRSCSEQLLELSTTLDPGRRREVMRTFGLRALKWPFKTSEVEKIGRAHV